LVRKLGARRCEKLDADNDQDEAESCGSGDDPSAPRWRLVGYPSRYDLELPAPFQDVIE
jgi:hypothetical protein